jgi:hypothetical protein
VVAGWVTTFMEGLAPCCGSAPRAAVSLQGQLVLEELR